MRNWVAVDKRWINAGVPLAAGVQLEVRHFRESSLYDDYEEHPGIKVAPYTWRYLIGDLDARLSSGDDGDWFHPEDRVLRYRMMVDNSAV